MSKRPLGIDVLTAAKQRISYVFDNFPKIYLSFSGGKDSTVMLHLVMEEAIKRNRIVGLLFVDLEGQYKITIQHIIDMYQLYADNINQFWCCLEIALRNAVSTFQPKWKCWDRKEKERWIREMPDKAKVNEDFPFFYSGMEFEEFVPKFGEWYSNGKLTACFVGIRSDESLNRYRTLAGKKSKFEDKNWTTWCGGSVYNIYPIYDWKTQDIWRYHGKFYKPYNRLYDLMYKAGVSIHLQRICQPYGDDQRRGLWLFHIIEPETWGKVVARVNGANSGAIYIQEHGNINGTIKINKPEGHTWQSFAMLLINSMPAKTKNHFENKMVIFLKWWSDRGYQDGIPDEASPDEENHKKVPSWRRVCKALLRNDYWCKGLSFTQTKAEAYDRYCKIMKKRKQQWKMLGLMTIR
jgi:predicted phosphoadenosine phosphosulfate sulfurtransferase